MVPNLWYQREYVLKNGVKVVEQENEIKKLKEKLAEKERKITKVEEKFDQKEIEIEELKSKNLMASTQLQEKETKLMKAQQIIQNFEREKNDQSTQTSANTNGCDIAGALLRIMGDDTNFSDNFNTQTCGRGFKGRHVLRPDHKLDRKLREFPITFESISRDELQIFYDVTEDEFHERLDRRRFL